MHGACRVLRRDRKQAGETRFQRESAMGEIKQGDVVDSEERGQKDQSRVGL